MDKRIIFSDHAKIKMADRGTFEDEVIKAIKEGSSEPSKKGRLLFRKNFPFNSLCGEENSIQLNRLPL